MYTLDDDYGQLAMRDASRLSGLPMAPLPTVHVMNDWELLDACGRADVFGAYHWGPRHEIVMRAPWNPANVDNWGTLVHEMVHALQCASLGYPAQLPDPKATERQAYAVECLWYQEKGLLQEHLGGPLRDAKLATLFRATGIPWWNDGQVAVNMAEYATRALDPRRYRV